jgi:hypothetical protein
MAVVRQKLHLAPCSKLPSHLLKPQGKLVRVIRVERAGGFYHRGKHAAHARLVACRSGDEPPLGRILPGGPTTIVRLNQRCRG